MFIMTDQMRYDAMGHTGGWTKTPNLDRIATEGISFSNCVTTSPVCMPARITMATGLYPHNTGIWDNCRYTLPIDTPTWMQVVRDSGYRTALIGKTHLYDHCSDWDLRDASRLNAYGMQDVNEIGGPRASAHVQSHMTEEWNTKGIWRDYQDDYSERFRNKPHTVRPSALPLDDYADIYVGRKAEEYLKNYNREEPWFCWVSFGGPHEPWDTPEPYASMYNPADMPQPIPATNEEFDSQKMSQMTSPEFDINDIAEMRANYAGNVTLIDEQIGRLINVLEKRGELDNTVIIFTSDHGEMNGDHGAIYKGIFYDSAVRVPMLVRAPGVIKEDARGKVCSSPVEWSDAGPTIVDLIGGKFSYKQFAKSLTPTLKDPTILHREEAISEIGGEYMVMTENWKLCVNDRKAPYALFDRKNDPNEQKNQVNDQAYQNTVENMMNRLKKRIESCR